MAKEARFFPDIDWIQRDRRVIEGLDHLGVQLVSVNLYQAILPGISNVTERARYYSFYPWCIHKYAQEGPTTRTRANWVKWLRRIDFAYAVASLAYDQQDGHESGSAVVGGDRASELLAGKTLASVIDLKGATAVDESGKVDGTDAYFKNPQGGLGQYYRGPLLQMALVVEHGESAWPDVSLTKYAGQKMAEVLDGQAGFRELLEIAARGRATVEDFAEVGSKVHPSTIISGSREEAILRGIFLGTDADVCQGQARGEKEWRRRSLRLMLDYLQRSQLIEEAPDYEFRWACLAKALPDGSAWQCSSELSKVRAAWGVYQRNDTLNFCLESLMTTVMELLDKQGPLHPRKIADQIADMAMASVDRDEDFARIPALRKRVSEWVDACALSTEKVIVDPWGEQSTWQWADRLQSANSERDLPRISGLAVRLLGRLVSDRGDLPKNAFASIPHASQMAKSHEVHIERWWDLVASQEGTATKEFLIRLLLDWVIFRHLRVATRKLANQGVSTYKFRPEEGKLVLVTERPPPATFTSPRLRQGYRILSDLHLVERGDDGWRITEDGSKAI